MKDVVCDLKLFPRIGTFMFHVHRYLYSVVSLFFGMLARLVWTPKAFPTDAMQANTIVEVRPTCPDSVQLFPLKRRPDARTHRERIAKREGTCIEPSI